MYSNSNENTDLVDFNIVSAVNTLKKFQKNIECDLNDLCSYLKCDVTKDTAKYYINLMDELNTVLGKTKINKKTKEAAAILFNTVVMKACESECRAEIIDDLGQQNAILCEKVNELSEKWQIERDEHNKVLEEINRAKKSEKVDLPALELSIILKDPKRKLTNLESIKIRENAYNSIGAINNKMKKLDVKNIKSDNIKNKIVRAYVKESPDGVERINQKPSSSSTLIFKSPIRPDY